MKNHTLTVWKASQQVKPQSKQSDTLATISLIALIAISFTLSIVHTTHTNKPNITDAQINALYEQDQRGEITLSQEQINNLNALDHLN